MKIILPRLPARTKRADHLPRKVFRLFKRLDNGRFMIAGWVTKYPKSAMRLRGGGLVMAAKLHIDKSLFPAGFEEKLSDTYLGQAHIAGTGPVGSRCRGCSFWTNEKNGWDREKSKEAYCTYRITGKRMRQIPGSALSCRFFNPIAQPVGTAA